jgi:hypothetical protein
MGFYSDQTRGYEHGFHDSFLNHLKSYRQTKFNSVLKYWFAKSTPELQYKEGYDDGFKHGEAARKKYIQYTGRTPLSVSDFDWLNSERERQKKVDHFNTNLKSEVHIIAYYRNKYKELKELISEGRVYGTLKDLKSFFYEIKNFYAYTFSSELLRRLEKNRINKTIVFITQKDTDPEFNEILFLTDKLIETEIKSIIDSNDKYHHSKITAVDYESRKINGATAADFVLVNEELIQHIIINNWKIPKTNIPGIYAETFNKVAKWFDNFKKKEYELALLVLQNIKLFGPNEIDQLLNKVCGELRNLFNGDFSKVSFFGIGHSSSESGSQFLYSLRQKLQLTSINFPTNYNHLHSSMESIVFIDDIIGSGNQAKNFCSEFLININIKKYYYSLLAFESGLANLKMNSGFTDVFSAKILYESEKAFSDKSEIFPDSTIRARVKEMAFFYGEMLYPKGPLGYDDSQALIAFSHNTPNNTLPIIWASENNEKTIGIPWNPILERKKTLTKPN